MRTIDVDELINNINEFAECVKAGSEFTRGYIAAHKNFAKFLAEQPTIEQPKWISCAERLPKHGDIVICNTQFFIEVMQWDERSEVWISKTSIHGKQYVDYWLSLKALPQPPKGDE